METVRKKRYNPDNCDSLVRGVYQISDNTKIIITGQYAHKWSIHIIKTIFQKESVTTYSYNNGAQARKALQILLRKIKPNQLK